MTTRHPLLTAALTLLLVLPALAAQAADTDGFERWVLGVDVIGSNLGEGEDGENGFIDETGGGGAMQFGYRFSSSFLLRIYGSGAVHKTDIEDVEIAFGGGMVEAVYLFRDGAAFRPCIFGGLGGYGAESTVDHFTYQMEGLAASFGLGAYWFLTPHWSLHSSLRVEAVNWETATIAVEDVVGGGDIEVEVPIDDSGTASKFTVGLGFWF